MKQLTEPSTVQLRCDRCKRRATATLGFGGPHGPVTWCLALCRRHYDDALYALNAAGVLISAKGSAERAKEDRVLRKLADMEPAIAELLKH